MPFKPPVLNLGASLAESTSFDSYRPLPNVAESLQISDGCVSRIKEDQEYSVEICEKDITFLSILGSGASSRVYKGILSRRGHGGPPKYVAVKKISHLDEGLQRQMKKDVKVLMDANRARDAPGAGNFAGLVKFEGAYLNTEDQEVAIVLEYMDSGSLEDVKTRVGKIPEPELSRVIQMALEGLLFLHKHLRIVHRDIKPANVLLSSDGSAKIADFGIARSLESTQAMCETFMGTFSYMAPERFNSKPYGFSSDIWSLGVCVIECATGKYPFDTSGSAFQLMLSIMQTSSPLLEKGVCSDELQDFCEQCLKAEPSERATAAQLLSHPWILKHQLEPVDMAGYMQKTMDPHAVLDELAYFFAHQYYELLTAIMSEQPHTALTAQECLKKMYTETSVYSSSIGAEEGQKGAFRRPCGPTLITALIVERLRLFRQWGASKFTVKSVDCCAVPGGQEKVMIVVQGELTGAIPERIYSDMFVLCCYSDHVGQHCMVIGNQSFSLL